MTTTTKAEPAEDTVGMGPPLLPRPPRGRHRRPRPRKVLLAVGGLAVAAGVLSLVRLTPDSGVGGVGTAEAEPSPDVDAEQSTGHPANADATISADPTAIPSATSVMGGASATPTTASGVVPPTYATAAPTTVPETTTAPGTTPQPRASATAPGPRAPAPSEAPEPATTPAPPPSRAADSPAPAPGRPSLCVPVIGLCVDPLVHGG